MTNPDPFLEWSEKAQIVLAVLTFLTLLVIWMQYRAGRIFELSKYLEDPHIRNARRLVYKELKEKALKGQAPPPEWWNNPEYDKLEKSAATVCASFSTVGVVSEKVFIKTFIVQEWANSICWSYKVLERYIAHRRHSENLDAYAPYERLYHSAKQQQSGMMIKKFWLTNWFAVVCAALLFEAHLHWFLFAASNRKPEAVAGFGATMVVFGIFLAVRPIFRTGVRKSIEGEAIKRLPGVGIYPLSHEDNEAIRRAQKATEIDVMADWLGLVLIFLGTLISSYSGALAHFIAHALSI